VLAQLNEISGVQSTSASLGNPGGTLVQISVRPGADPAKVADAVQRIFRQTIKERSAVQLSSQSAAASLREKQWLNPTQLAEVAATGPATAVGRGRSLLGALLLAGIGVALGLLGWQHLRQRRAGSSP